MPGGDSPVRFVPRPGALRYRSEDGEWQQANPRDIMFSTVTMLATEYWTADKGWLPIFDDTTTGESHND